MGASDPIHDPRDKALARLVLSGYPAIAHITVHDLRVIWNLAWAAAHDHYRGDEPGPMPPLA